MNKPLVSVIIPVYNVGKYIIQCLESVKNQDYNNFEALIIDDGSTDNSFELCSNCIKNDVRFTIYRKKNCGLSDARNYGLDRMNGEYVLFLDSDDYISSDCLSSMVQKAVETGVDIVSGGYQRFNNKGELLQKHVHSDCEILNKTDSMKEMISQGKTTTMACAKLYKKELFENLRFDVGKYHEDIFLMHLIFERINTLAVINRVIYYYRINPNSITGSGFVNKSQDAVYAEGERFKFIKEKYPEYLCIQLQFYVWYSVYNNCLILKHYQKEYYKYFKYNNNIIKKYLKPFLKSKASLKAKLFALFCLLSSCIIRE